MRKSTGTFLTAGKVSTFQKRKVRARRAKGYPVVLVIGPDTRESVAPRHVALEVVYI